MGCSLSAACTELTGSSPAPDASLDAVDADANDVSVRADGSDGSGAPDVWCPARDSGLAPGSRDPTFGGGRFDAPRGFFIVRGAMLDARGRIYVYGVINNCVSATSSFDLGVVRHLENGDVDEDFGQGGYACWDGPLPSTEADEFLAGTVDAQGRAYLVGHSDVGGVSNATMVRLDEVGGLDSTFNGGRVVMHQHTLAGQMPYAYASGVVADARGVFLVGAGSSLGWVARYSDDGYVDTAFGGSPAALDLSVTAWLGAARVGDAMLLSGIRRSDGAMVVRRMGFDGVVDASFGDHGYAVAPAVMNAQPRAITAFADGGFAVAVASGSTDVNQTRSTAVRFTAAGALVTSFGSGGAHVSVFGLQPDYERHVIAAQCDGSLLLGGDYRVSAMESYGATSRLDDRGRLDPHFGTAGVVYSEHMTEGIAAVMVRADTGAIYVVSRDGHQRFYSVYRYAP